MTGLPDRFVVSSQGQLAPRVSDPYTDGNPYVVADQGYTSLLDFPDPPVPVDQGAFDGRNAFQGSRTASNMGDIVREGSAGEDVVRLDDPRAGYASILPSVQGSADPKNREIHPTASIATQIKRVIPIARYAWPKRDDHSRSRGGADLTEGTPPTPTQPWKGMRPQGIFPGRVTDWPKAVPRWLTFGETAGGSTSARGA